MANLHDNINIFSGYRLEENDITLFEPCFCITLFSNEVVTKEHGPESLLTPYRVFWEDFGNQVERILFDFNQKSGVKITDKNQKIPYEWLADPKKRSRGGAIIDLYTSTQKLERRTPRLQWYYDSASPEINQPGNSYYRVQLPLSWVAENDVKAIGNYIMRMVKDFPLSYGYAGFSLCCHDGEVLTRKDLEAYLKQWIERHPGIMSPDPNIESQWSAKINGVTSVGWITLLGAEYCNRMGGLAELQQKMSTIPDVHVTPFIGQGAMIRIGDTPVLGDTMKNDYLDSYRAVGQVLQPLHRISERLETDYLHVTGIDGKEARKKWFNRFFDSREGK